MKTVRILAISMTVLALAACGRNPDHPDTQQPQAQQGDNGWLWGVGGFLLGRMTAPTPQVGQQAPVYQQQAPVYQPQYQAPAAPAVTPAIGSAVQPVAPAKPSVQLPQVKPVDKPPVYAGPSGYSSVTQGAPTFKIPPLANAAPSLGSAAPKLAPTPVTPVTRPAPVPAPKSVPTPAPAPKPAVSYSFKPAPAPAYRAPAPAPRPAPAPARSK